VNIAAALTARVRRIRATLDSAMTSEAVAKKACPVATAVRVKRNMRLVIPEYLIDQECPASHPMKYGIAVLLFVTACSHSDTTDKSQPGTPPTRGSSSPDNDNDNDDAITLDCAADIASADIKGLLTAPFKTQTLNADRDKNGCSFEAEHFAAVRVYLSTGGSGDAVYAMVQASGNIAPLAGVGDKALRGTSAFTKVVAAKGRSVCSIELAGVGNVGSEAELVAQSQEIREQKLGRICTKLFAAKKL
jgi:hypothetical protein